LVQLRECDMGATVNRDLQQRIRSISGFTLHQQITKSDIKKAAKIVQNFDNRWKMWDDDADKTDNCSQPVSLLYGVSNIYSVSQKSIPLNHQ